jgi:glyoxalase family protein
MRLVKKTVNQDDVSACHLFYADGKANPGTDLIFFDFSRRRRPADLAVRGWRGGTGRAVGAQRGAGQAPDPRPRPIVLYVHDLARAADVLTEVMNVHRLRDYVAPDAAAQVHVFGMGEGGPAAELHVIGA